MVNTELTRLVQLVRPVLRSFRLSGQLKCTPTRLCPPIWTRPSQLQKTHLGGLASVCAASACPNSRLDTVASAKLDNPHPKIHPRDYYKLVDPDQSDPVRLRQLLLWCANASKSTKQSHVDPVVTAVQLEFVKMLKTRHLSTSWYHRPAVDNEDDSNEFVEHPLNIENKQKLGMFQAQVDRY